MTQKEHILEYLKHKDFVESSRILDWLEMYGFSRTDTSTALSIMVEEGALTRKENRLISINRGSSAEVMVGIGGYAKSTPQQILSIACSICGESKEDVISPKRNRELVDVRKIYAMLSKKYLKRFSLVRIGKEINNTHATIIHHIRTGEELLSYDKVFRNNYELARTEVSKYVKRSKKEKAYDPTHIGYYYNRPDELSKHYDL